MKCQSYEVTNISEFGIVKYKLDSILTYEKNNCFFSQFL